MVYHGSRAPNYGDGDFRDLEDEVLVAVRAFERSGVGKNIVIVATGVSGMSLAFPLACKLGVDVAILRKPKEDSHGTPGRFVGVSLKGRTCVFVDDFVSGGQTRQRVATAVRKDKGLLKWQYTSREEAFVPISERVC
jgi:phosphoribosylpyrophosphate synthetase